MGRMTYEDLKVELNMIRLECDAIKGRVEQVLNRMVQERVGQMADIYMGHQIVSEPKVTVAPVGAGTVDDEEPREYRRKGIVVIAKDGPDLSDSEPEAYKEVKAEITETKTFYYSKTTGNPVDVPDHFDPAVSEDIVKNEDEDEFSVAVAEIEE